MYSNQRTTEMAAPTKRGSPQGYYAAGKRATNRVGKNEVFKPPKKRVQMLMNSLSVITFYIHVKRN